MDSDNTSPAANVHGVEAAESPVGHEFPRDTIFSGAALTGGDSASPQDVALPGSPAASHETEPRQTSELAETAVLRLRHADAVASPPQVLIERLSHWSMLAIGIPSAVMFGGFAVLAYQDGERLASLAFIPFVLLGCLLPYFWLRMRLIADRDGILIRHEFRSDRIPWSDVDWIEFDVHPATPDSAESTTLVFVTREQVRIPEPNLSGSTDPDGYLYRLALSLLAMRDAYAPGLGHPGDAPADQDGYSTAQHREPPLK